MAKKSSKKKQTKRSKKKYPYLEKRVNSRVRQEYLDYDYVDQLSDEEKEFLNKFSGEHYGGTFQKDGSDLTANDDEGYRESYNRNNARNRDLYGRVRNKVGATKLLNYDDTINIVEEHLTRDKNPENLEDAIIDYLDEKIINSSSDTDDSSDNSN